jgi:DNA (cytosine-5)-methyltransferase 1
MTMTIGSLFSGIGGLELGLEWAGLGPTLWQVEREPYAQTILARHWPDATRYDDVCAVGGQDLARVDVMCGGFPCQDISFAGKGAGLAGARSGLWSEYVRIVREVRPRFVIVENVAALLGRGLGRVLGDLAESGYDAWWDCVPASACGAPHRRDRLFVVAYSASARCEREARARVQGPWRAPIGSASYLGSVRGNGSNEPDMGRTVNGISRGLDGHWPAGPGQEQYAWEFPRTSPKVPNRQNRLKCLGNAVVPQVGYVIGQVVNEIVKWQER